MMTLSDLTNVPSNDPHDCEANKRDADRPHYNINNQELYDAERAPTDRFPTVPSLMERCNSYTSNVSSDQDICRICHCEGDEEAPLIAPCLCAGSLRYVHQSCLQQWIKSSDTKCCELCKFNFIMHSKIKAFNKWEKLDMSGMERRKIACSVTFHVVAVTCVVWSLYVLIERTTVEVQEGHLEWPFWTKLIVVAIGFTGGLVFMYVQCKMYIQLCRRWRAFNRVIYVQNAPEKVPLSERERCDLQREAPQQCCGGGGVKESCSESHESEKSLMGVLSGIRRPRTTPLNTGQNIQKPPVADTRSLPISTHQTFETPFIYEGRNSNYGSMEELSSHALVQNEVAPFRKSSSHSVCLEKGIEVNLVGAAPRHESQFEVRVHSHGSRIGTTLRRVETSEATIPETRMIHTPLNLGLQRRTDSGSNASDVESLHLENM